MIRHLLLIGCSLAIPAVGLADEASVQVEPPQLHGSRPLEKQTESAVVRDYLESWRTLNTALSENNAAVLNADFIGFAHDKLAETIAEQSKAGIQTRYQDLSHDLQFVFYSPEGQSIQLIDTVEYSEQLLDHGKVVTTQRIKARYVVVLTPAQVRWQVRVFQAEAAE
jgi:aromatic ring-opening dioxygenase LigB subunit